MKPPLAPDDPRHGTLNGYGNLGCRCDRCRAANTAAHRDYMRAHPEQYRRQTRTERRKRTGDPDRRCRACSSRLPETGRNPFCGRCQWVRLTIKDRRCVDCGARPVRQLRCSDCAYRHHLQMQVVRDGRSRPVAAVAPGTPGSVTCSACGYTRARLGGPLPYFCPTCNADLRDGGWVVTPPAPVVRPRLSCPACGYVRPSALRGRPPRFCPICAVEVAAHGGWHTTPKGPE